MKRDQKLKTEWPKFWRLKFRGILAKNDWLQLQVFSQEPQTGIIYIYIYILHIQVIIYIYIYIHMHIHTPIVALGDDIKLMILTGLARLSQALGNMQKRSRLLRRKWPGTLW